MRAAVTRLWSPTREPPPLLKVSVRRRPLVRCVVCGDAFASPAHLGRHLVRYPSHGDYPPTDYALRVVTRYAWLPIRFEGRWRWRCHYRVVERFEPDGQWTTGLWVPIQRTAH